MDAFVSALLLLSSLVVAAFFVATGVERFLGGRATGFSTLGAPRVAFPWSVVLGLAEVGLGVSVLVAPPVGMVAAYVAMITIAVYTWRANRSYRSQDAERATRAQVATLVGLAGVSVVALADSIALVSPLMRMFDPLTLVWLLAFGVAGGAAVFALRGGFTLRRTAEARGSVHR